MMNGPEHKPCLLVIDMQNIFGDPTSAWYTPRFAEIIPSIERLMAEAEPRVYFSRFLALDQPQGSWISYYAEWPFALQRPDSPAYQLTDAFRVKTGTRIDATTFSKWTPELASVVPIETPLWLAGVSTDCCVLSTALAAADDGRYVKVVADACAGVDDASHARALDVMRLYRPHIEVIESNELLTEAGHA